MNLPVPGPLYWALEGREWVEDALLLFECNLEVLLRCNPWIESSFVTSRSGEGTCDRVAE